MSCGGWGRGVEGRGLKMKKREKGRGFECLVGKAIPASHGQFLGRRWTTGCVQSGRRIVCDTGCVPVKKKNKKKKNSETRMTASVRKQDPNTWKVKVKAYLIPQYTACEFSG